MSERTAARSHRVEAAPRRTAALAALVAAAALASGCGSSKPSGTSADPASVVPAASPLYVAADVRPEGAELKGATALGRALGHGGGEPYVRLLAALRTPGSQPLRYEREVKPWLGPHAGLFLGSLSEAQTLTPLLERVLLGSSSSQGFPFAGAGARGAIVLDTSDSSAASSFLHRQAMLAGAHATSWHGVSYMVGSGAAFGIVRRFAVIGSEAGLRAVIETSQGAPSIRSAGSYATLSGSAPREALAHVYADPEAGSSGLVGLLAGSRPAEVSLVPSGSSLTIYVDGQGHAAGAGGLLAAGTEGAQMLSRLPGSSWLAAGLADLSANVRGDVSGLRQLATLGASGAPGASSTTALSFSGLLEGLLAPLSAMAGAGPQLTGWMGSGGIFASGSGLLELKAAVVIESTQASQSRAAVGRLATLLAHAGDGVSAASIPGTEASRAVHVPGLPVELDLAAGRNSAGQPMFVLGLAEASVQEALHPASVLAASPTLAGAASTLGEGDAPTLVFQVPTLLGLLEGIGLTEDPALARLLPTLRSVTEVTGGGRQTAAGERFKLVVGLAGG